MMCLRCLVCTLVAVSLISAPWLTIRTYTHDNYVTPCKVICMMQDVRKLAYFPFSITTFHIFQPKSRDLKGLGHDAFWWGCLRFSGVGRVAVEITDLTPCGTLIMVILYINKVKTADLADSLRNRTTQVCSSVDGVPPRNSLMVPASFPSTTEHPPQTSSPPPSADSIPADDDLVPPMTERPDKSLILADSPVMYVKLRIQKVECVRPHCLR